MIWAWDALVDRSLRLAMVYISAIRQIEGTLDDLSLGRMTYKSWLAYVVRCIEHVNQGHYMG